MKLRAIFAALAAATLLAGHNSAHAVVVTGTYDPRTIDGSQTTGTNPYVLTSTDSTASWLRFTPNETFTFAEMTSLSVRFNSPIANALGIQNPLNAGGGGGAPRLTLVFDSNNDNAADGFFHIHMGTSPSFVDTPTTLNLYSGLSVLNNDTGRFDLSPAGGSPFTDYNAALSLVGNARIMRYTVFVDSFGGADKTLEITSIDASFTPVPEASAMLFGGLALTATGAGYGLRRRKA